MRRVSPVNLVEADSMILRGRAEKDRHGDQAEGHGHRGRHVSMGLPACRCRTSVFRAGRPCALEPDCAMGRHLFQKVIRGVAFDGDDLRTQASGRLGARPLSSGIGHGLHERREGRPTPAPRRCFPSDGRPEAGKQEREFQEVRLPIIHESGSWQLFTPHVRKGAKGCASQPVHRSGIIDPELRIPDSSS